MSTLFGLSKNPEKYEAAALKNEQKGKLQKALKNREKAQQLRLHQAANGPNAVLPRPANATPRTYTTYETKAVNWEAKQNWAKAQKNREKAWRLQYPQYAQTAAPQFYQNNRFVGYNTGAGVNTGLNTGLNTGFAGVNTGVNAGVAAHSVVAPAIVETHVRPVIVEQSVRTEVITEVQPVVHREVDAPHVKVIEKHIYENVASAGNRTVTNAAIVEETVKPRIIEEIQPVVHRNVAQTVVEKVEQHTTQHIVAPTTTSKQVIQDSQVRVIGAATSTKPIRTYTHYETKATGYEGRSNWAKAQRNREKAWRLQNPQYVQAPAPQFYQNNQFIGYSHPTILQKLEGYRANHATQAGVASQAGVAPVGLNAGVNANNRVL